MFSMKCVCLLWVYLSHALSDCEIDLQNATGSPFHWPLILKRNGRPYGSLPKSHGTNDELQFIQPNAWSGKVEIKPSDVIFACPGKGNSFKRYPDTKLIAAQCEGTQLRYTGEVHSFEDFQCKIGPKSSVQQSNTVHASNVKHLQIGFNVEESFLELMEVCFDASTLKTLWSKNTVQPSSTVRQKKTTDRRPWYPGKFYPEMNPDKLYSFKEQQKTMKLLLGSNQTLKYFKKNSIFLSRGHLSPSGDYSLESHKFGTYYFINAAPQWQPFNGANWNAVENSVREYSKAVKEKLIVYTGTYGVAKLPDENDNPINLYLYIRNGEEKIPVPAVYWKVVYNPRTQRAVAIIGENNPHERAQPAMQLCDKKVDNLVSWVRWIPNNVTQGICYLCKVDDFRAKVNTLPEFRVSGLLT